MLEYFSANSLLGMAYTIVHLVIGLQDRLTEYVVGSTVCDFEQSYCKALQVVL